MKTIMSLLIAGMLLFPALSFAATYTPAQISAMETLLASLELELQGLLNQENTCASGQEMVSGACEWTASSTATILLGQKQAQEAPYQNEIQNWQADESTMRNAIANATQEYQQDQTEVASLNSQLVSMCHLSTTIAQGNALAALQAQGLACTDESSVLIREEQGLDTNETTLQNTITTDQAEEASDASNITFAQNQIQAIQGQ